MVRVLMETFDWLHPHHSQTDEGVVLLPFPQCQLLGSNSDLSMGTWKELPGAS